MRIGTAAARSATRTFSVGVWASAMSPGPSTTQGAIAWSSEASVPYGAVPAGLPTRSTQQAHQRMVSRQFRREAFARLAHRDAEAAGRAVHGLQHGRRIDLG